MRGQVKSLWKPARWLLLAVVVAGAVFLLVQPGADAQQGGPRRGYGPPEMADRGPADPPSYGRRGGRGYRRGRGGPGQQAGPGRGRGMRGPGAGMQRRGGGANLTANDNYVYVLVRGTLLQFDAESLELVNKTSLRPDRSETSPEEGEAPPGRRMHRGPRRGGQYGPPGDRPEWPRRRGRGGWRAPEGE